MNEFTGFLARSVKMADAERAAGRRAEVERRARHIAAGQAAAAAGLSGADAAMFERGFAGADIKWANPRAEGREAQFRAGRAAAASAAGRASIRAAVAQAEQNVPPVAQWRAGWDACNPEQD